MRDQKAVNGGKRARRARLAEQGPPARWCTHRAKRRYETEQGADAALTMIADKAAQLGKKAPVRSYHCSCCSGWHLTSMPKAGP